MHNQGANATRKIYERTLDLEVLFPWPCTNTVTQTLEYGDHIPCLKVQIKCYIPGGGKSAEDAFNAYSKNCAIAIAMAGERASVVQAYLHAQ